MQPQLRSASVIGCCFVAQLGCSLDQRQLQPASEAGSEAGGSMSAGGQTSEAGGTGSVDGGSAGSVIAAAGEAGMGGQLPTPSDACPDLDGNQVPDCAETRVENANFATSVDGWQPDTDSQLSWADDDANGNRSSGSALVSSAGVIDAAASGSALRAASQCLAVSGKQLVSVYGNAWVDAEQDSAGQAQLVVFFFDGEQCAGAFTSSFSTPQPLDAKTNSWMVLKAGAVTPSSNRSLLVKLAVAKPFRAASFRARFDNVLVKIQSP